MRLIPLPRNTNTNTNFIFFLSLFFTTALTKQIPTTTTTRRTATLPSLPSEIISRFQEYLRINTSQPNPDYSKAVDFILSQAKSLSLESQVIEFVKDKPLILLKWPGLFPNLPSVLLNSHTDVVPVESHKWSYPPFQAHIDSHGNIFARGSQDMKCVGMQYLEAIRNLKSTGFEPIRTIYLSYVPDEEIGGRDGAENFAKSHVFKQMNVGFVLDEGRPSPDENYHIFYAERSPMWLVIKAIGAPGHGAKLYDNTATENLLKSIESIQQYRASQFELLKAGLKTAGEVVSVNVVFLKAGIQTPAGFVRNIQPSEAEAGIDIRVPPTIDQVAFEKRIADEWAPALRNMTFKFEEKFSVLDKFGKPAMTVANSSNPWWMLLEEAIHDGGGKLEKPDIFPGGTDANFFRQQGIPAIGFSPIANTPSLAHGHNEVLNSKGVIG
ncbi:uncharacterized protein LOC141611638 isoform X2 [Silene latifolia]|uniref:uncharacterized protein LOC141611638 isoform X2 n=1 Tax=Silene latifolia TaxID=37657 RepID=UPI003D776EC9